jgi:hypothetical protein
MNRVRIAFAATVVGLALVGADAAIAGQTAPQGSSPQDLQPILAGKKFTPPIKGQAEVEFTKPVTKREKDMVVTTIQVKNVSNAPIPRLTIDESWYDKSGGMIPGGKGVVNGLLQPGEVATVKIETPFNAKMSSNNWNFSHANGTVKPHLVKSFDAAADAKKEPATTKATAKKK